MRSESVCPRCGEPVKRKALSCDRCGGEWLVSQKTIDAVAALHEPPEQTTIPTTELDRLLAVATVYVDAFGADETMSLPERLALQEVEDILARRGRRY
ncbi:hypothetical protein [Mycolicibacterium sphagni]|uniref:hypothetical protein n=1 Tax=Mycolicibacterium sphagni TaxID=1786 RepID=UPI0021F25E4E|nr:hypothetical protein [Mycolicibacterium sphagni]MCV7174951.1 hypothetical protein [Mycolicibacterium sphagni]